MPYTLTPFKYVVGQTVLAINAYGTVIGPKCITGYKRDEMGNAYTVTPTDSPWSPWREEYLHPVPADQIQPSFIHWDEFNQGYLNGTYYEDSPPYSAITFAK